MLGEFNMQAEPHKRAMLEQACRVLDQLAELDEAVKGQPTTVLGYNRQLTIHPLISQIGTERSRFAQLVKALGMPDSMPPDHDAEAAKAEMRRARAKHAADTRWKKAREQ
jgi:hypothetical protein